VHKIVSLEQQRLPRCTGQGVSEAVPKFSRAGWLLPPAKIAIGFSSDPRLHFGNRFDDELRLVDEVVNSLTRSSKRRLATGSRDPSITIAASTKFAADTRR
jgi:hypothetical protein